MHRLRIAVSQFPVTEDVLANESYVARHMELAYRRGASVVHFPETALSGYDARVDTLDWSQIDRSLQRVRLLAGRYGLHVILGVHRRNAQSRKPFNATEVFSASGAHVGTYRKVNIYEKESDRFSSGSELLVVEINHIRCGFLICFDSCFPRLFREYRDAGVQLLFLSYYNARGLYEKSGLNELMKAQLQTRAADHGMYISASNSCARYSRIPSGVVSPDGVFVKLRRHRPGVLMYDYPSESLGWTYDNRSPRALQPRIAGT